MTALFLIGAAFCVWTWVGFPLLLHLRARTRPGIDVSQPPESLPSVSIVIAAHDEAATLPGKLASLDRLDYPTERMQWIIVSDGSRDATPALLEAAARERAHLSVLHYAQAAGKPTALNLAVEQATGELLVFMDARQTVAPDALLRLAAALTDEAIGAASGELSLATDGGGDAADVGLYWRYEKWIRDNESRLFSTTGATGALFAIRRTDFVPHDVDALLDDFDLPVRLLRRGLRTVFVPQARVFDRAETSAAGEFRRKARTLAGNFQSFSRQRWLFDPRRNPVFWQFLSHKVFRLLVPYAMALCLLAALLGEGAFLAAMLLVQLAFYALGAAGFLGVNSRITNFIRVFLQMNAAAVVGAVRWATGRAGGRWKGADDASPRSAA